MYFDGLLPGLKNSGYGSRLGNICIHGLAYADDVSLLSPKRNGMQKCWIPVPYMLKEMAWFSTVRRVSAQFLLRIDVLH